MPPEISEKEAKKIAARAGLARARQWRDERREMKSPLATATKTTTPPKTRASSKSPPATKLAPTPKKRTPSSKAEKAKKATKTGAVIEEREEISPSVWYRKTPSRDDRARMRAKARADAKEWSDRRKEKKVLRGEVPIVVETNDDEEVEDLSISDFKTAPLSEARMAPAPARIDGNTIKELTYLRNDMKNAYDRLTDICYNHADKIERDVMA